MASRPVLILGLLVTLLGGGRCDGAAAAPVRIFAAASTREAVSKVVANFQDSTGIPVIAEFGASSTLLALLYGVALGNVVRGVPLDSNGYFFLPLWTNLAPGSNAGVVDWYTLLIGLASLSALALHGTYWVTYKTGGDLQERSRSFGTRSWLVVVVLTAIVTLVSFQLDVLHHDGRPVKYGLAIFDAESLDTAVVDRLAIADQRLARR